MFDVGWSEMLVIAAVAVLVVGPKDLPKMLRGFGKTLTSLRKMASDFQKQFDNALKEAELDEVRKLASRPFQPLEEARKAALSFQKDVSTSVSALETAAKADLTPVPAIAGLPAGAADLPPTLMPPTLMPPTLMPPVHSIAAPPKPARSGRASRGKGAAAKPAKKPSKKPAGKAAATRRVAAPKIPKPSKPKAGLTVAKANAKRASGKKT